MDQARSSSGGNNNNIGEDNVGIPDDLRCKRSDGKQWRCTAMSMPDKTVCEKHYIQAKKRAANSAMRANLKKAKRKSHAAADSDTKSDDFDLPLSSAIKLADPSSGGSRFLDKVSKNQFRYVPEGKRGASGAARGALPRPSDDDSQEEEEEADAPQYEENWAGYDSPEPADSSRRRRSLDATNATTEYSDGSSDTSEDTGGQICHQCRRNDRGRVVTWCQRCDRRGYCDSCISTW